MRAGVANGWHVAICTRSDSSGHRVGLLVIRSFCSNRCSHSLGFDVQYLFDGRLVYPSQQIFDTAAHSVSNTLVNTDRFAAAGRRDLFPVAAQPEV